MNSASRIDTSATPQNIDDEGIFRIHKKDCRYLIKVTYILSVDHDEQNVEKILETKVNINVQSLSYI